MDWYDLTEDNAEKYFDHLDTVWLLYTVKGKAYLSIVTLRFIYEEEKLTELTIDLVTDFKNCNFHAEKLDLTIRKFESEHIEKLINVLMHLY